MDNRKNSVQYHGDINLAPNGNDEIVDGTITLFQNGQMRLVPIPSHHPDDPLSLPVWRKMLAILSVCLFGALGLATQQTVAGLLPVFMLEYAGIDPSVLNQPGGLFSVLMSHKPSPDHFPVSSSPSNPMYPQPPNSVPSAVPPADLNPLEALGELPGAQPLSRVNLLSSLPMLLIGISNYFLVPAAIVFGRRAVMLFCGIVATVCSIWAGVSTSLPSHLGARSVHAIGAGCIESLIPLIVQDMTYLHQRNRAMSIIALSQGLVGLALGIGSTYIVARLGWRWVYFTNAILTSASLLLMVAFLPETRWHRSTQELHGQRTEGTSHGYDPPSKATFNARFGLFANGGIRGSDGVISLLGILKTFGLPIVLYMILINAIFIGINLGSSLTSSTVLLASPYNWPIEHVGFSVIAVFVASLFVGLIGGYGSDALANWLSRRNGGIREAEHNLWNMIFPMGIGILGCILIGIGGELVSKVHWMALMSGVPMLTFAFLTTNLVSMVLCLECYPKLAGPILVNVASFRNIIGFAFTYGIPDWVAARGYFTVFGVFSGLIAILAMILPVFYLYGKQMRRKTGFIVTSIKCSL